MFYHDIKPHMSPSALSQWRNGRGQFVRSYFSGEKSPESKAMTAGTEIHALVEAGIIKATHTFLNNELELRQPVPGTSFMFLGRPDSFEAQDGVSVFVDYKSGKANGWDEKLPTDIKMRATAWLVWQATGCPKEVHGYVEYIQTTWDPEQKKVVPVDGKETEVASIIYTEDELSAFTHVIATAMHEVNAFYQTWLQSTSDFVSSKDIGRAVELRDSISTMEMELDEIQARILDQMEFGGIENHKTPHGTFFVKNTKTYEYPKELHFLLDGKEPFTLEKAERVASGVKAAKSNFELSNEPKEVRRSLQFRAAKEK